MFFTQSAIPTPICTAIAIQTENCVVAACAASASVPVACPIRAAWTAPSIGKPMPNIQCRVCIAISKSGYGMVLFNYTADLPLSRSACRPSRNVSRLVISRSRSEIRSAICCVRLVLRTIDSTAMTRAASPITTEMIVSSRAMSQHFPVLLQYEDLTQATSSANLI